jgi:Domain of unknown function (DUF4249)
MTSCIDPYSVDLARNNKILVVEGLLTDDIQNPDTISIQYSTSIEGNIRKIDIPSLQPVIKIVDSGKEIKLVEYAKGKYLPPKDFQIKQNEKYVLRFTIDGNNYESTPESIINTPPITDIYEKFNPISRLSEDGKTQLSANEVFIDFKDTPNQDNFYLWRYTLYERLQHCFTCYYSIYDFYSEKCIPPISYLRSPYYDYNCLSECYSIIRSTQINVMSDALSKGSLITGRLIAKIPYYYTSGCLVEVDQICVSPAAFAFYKVLESQSQSTGGLADSPPAAIIGNIQNLKNPAEKVVGYFGIANIQRKKIWIDRSKNTGVQDLILGHVPIEEPQNPPTRPPLARCQKSAKRTPFKPEGWQ